MSSKIRAFKYHLKALFSLKQKKYSEALNFLKKEVENDLSPETRGRINYDKLILEIAEKIYEASNKVIKRQEADFSNTHVLILNSEIYDTGGHTECAIRFINNFKDDFKITFLVAGMDNCCELAPKKMKDITNSVSNFVEFPIDMDVDKKIFEIYDYILENHITTIIANIHMQDTTSAAILGLIKKYTNINVIFWNHADHFFTLGTEFADKIITRCKNGKALAKNIKDKTNVVHLPFLEDYNPTITYTKDELDKKRVELGIPIDSFLTLTGCNLYKISSPQNEYFKLIKKILDNYSNVYHLIISDLTQKEKEKIEKIIGSNSNRLMFLDYQSNFTLFIQISDLYIDSFPQGSALTLVDYIKHSKPVVIKICEKNPIQSFETYLYENYEYACKTPEDMFKKIGRLIVEEAEYNRISQRVRAYYLNEYNIDNAKLQQAKLIK